MRAGGDWRWDFIFFLLWIERMKWKFRHDSACLSCRPWLLTLYIHTLKNLMHTSCFPQPSGFTSCLADTLPHPLHRPQSRERGSPTSGPVAGTSSEWQQSTPTGPEVSPRPADTSTPTEVRLLKNNCCKIVIDKFKENRTTNHRPDGILSSVRLPATSDPTIKCRLQAAAVDFNQSDS